MKIKQKCDKVGKFVVKRKSIAFLMVKKRQFGKKFVFGK